MGSKKQLLVTLSSTEAEYIAASSATQETIHLRNLLNELGHTQIGPTTLFMDNQSTIVLADNLILNQQTKHTNVKYHFICEHTRKKTIKPTYLPTDSMVTDPLTKPVGSQTLARVIVGLVGKP